MAMEVPCPANFAAADYRPWIARPACAVGLSSTCSLPGKLVEWMIATWARTASDTGSLLRPGKV